MVLELFPLPRVSLEKAVNGSGTGDSVLELLAWRGGAFAVQVEKEGDPLYLQLNQHERT